MPKSMTGPATVNILAPTPKTYPSLAESIASDTTAFANPVTGTSVPAPAILAILSKTPTDVRIDAIKIRVRVTSVEAVFSSIENIFI